MARNNDMTALNDVLEVMEPSPDALRGMTVCITGHLGKPRDQIVEMIRKAGGRFDKSVRWGVTHLVTNADWNAGSVKGKVSSKYRKAQEYGVKIISEAELYALMMKED